MTEKEKKGKGEDESEVKNQKPDVITEEELELEENLEENVKKTKISTKGKINIDENKFQDVMVNITKSPSLEQVAVASEPLISLETGLTEAPMVKEDKDNIKYSAINYDNTKEKPYSESAKVSDENLMIGSNLPMARQNLRETIQADTRQNFQINPEFQGMKSTQDDYSVKAPTSEFKEAKSHDPFQKSTKEYEFR